MKLPLRIGNGFDAHAFSRSEERPLILGGVVIPHRWGLVGHSDADALYHALGDAILGALGRPDLGHYFPDTDPAWKGADSGAILRDVARLMTEDGYRPLNVDTVIIAQEPRLAPYVPAMKENIGSLLGLPPGAVGVKATTTEHLGFTGRGEGIAALAVVLLSGDEHDAP